MTKENKLALVVGFGLILLVGILVSDHYSAARSQEAADLLPAHDPLVDLDAARPELLNMAPAANKKTFDAPSMPESRHLPIDTGSGGLVLTPPLKTRRADLAAQDLTQRSTQPQPIPDHRSTQAPQKPSTDRFHEVASGESLTTICRRYFGGDKQVLALAKYNGLSDPDMLRAGARLRIPADQGQLTGRKAPSQEAPPTADKKPARKPEKDETYTVRSGDVLSLIAQRELGSARLWQQLYKHNQDVINDPDHLEVGTVLKFPPS